MKPSSTSRPLTLCRKSAAMSGATRTAGARPHPLTGLLYCADCGGKMYVHRTNNGKRISQYTCCQLHQSPMSGRSALHSTVSMQSAVLTLVSDMLRAIAEYSRNDRAEFIRTVQETQVAQQTRRYIEKAETAGRRPKESRRTGKTDLQNL